MFEGVNCPKITNTIGGDFYSFSASVNAVALNILTKRSLSCFYWCARRQCLTVVKFVTLPRSEALWGNTVVMVSEKWLWSFILVYNWTALLFIDCVVVAWCQLTFFFVLSISRKCEDSNVIRLSSLYINLYFSFKTNGEKWALELIMSIKLQLQCQGSLDLSNCWCVWL